MMSFLLSFQLTVFAANDIDTVEQPSDDSLVQGITQERSLEILENSIEKVDSLSETLDDLDISENITSEELEIISGVADVEVDERAEGGMQIKEYTFTPIEAINTAIFKSGRTEELYHKVSYTYAKVSGEGSTSDTINTSDITLKSEIYYYQYNMTAYMKAAKLYRAEGTIVRFLENGLRDLGISTFCTGERLDEYGASYAMGSESHNGSNISAPFVGVTYSVNPNFNYYYYVDYTGFLKADVYVQYRHGTTNWYTIASTTQIGTLPDIGVGH